MSQSSVGQVGISQRLGAAHASMFADAGAFSPFFLADEVLGAPYDVFHHSADAQALMLRFMREVFALAEKLAFDLSEKDIEEWLAVLATLAPEGKTSMLQDVEAKRKQRSRFSPVGWCPWENSTASQPR